MQWIVEAGQMTVRVGASSTDVRLTGAFEVKNTAAVGGSRRLLSHGHRRLIVD